MVKLRLRKFGKARPKLAWGPDQVEAAETIARRMLSGNAAKGKAARRKTVTVELEDQFNIGTGPRSSKWWDLWKDGINNSGLGLWLACRHQFWLRYVCGYNRSVYADAIEFGNIFHALIERWLLQRRLKDAEIYLRKIYHPKWVEGYTGEILTPANKQTQEGFYTLAAAMWPIYADKYKADLKRKSLAVEREFEVCHTLRNGKGVTLYGTMDHVFRVEGGVQIDDHKTSSFINAYEKEQALKLDLQLLFYAHAWELEYPRRPVVRVSHDVIRRTTSKQHRGESLGGYFKRIRREVEKAPDYYFQRFPVDVTPAKLASYRAHIINPIIEDFALWASGKGAHYPNPNALVGRYGPCGLFGNITAGNFAGVPRKRPTTRGVEI